MRYGVQYYRPPHPDPSCWEQDLANIRELGFNTVKLWAVWNSIERRPGEFDFSILDQLVETAERNCLEVVINIIPEGAPYWMETGNEDGLYITADGEKVHFTGAENMPSAGWPGLCMDHPKAEAYLVRFIETLTAHYANNDTVALFDVWNEPHLEPMFAYRGGMLCYCEHSKRRFVQWLQEKYGTIEALNRAWYRYYTDWDQVQPPVRMSTWTDMMDWRMFWLWNMTRWLKVRTAAAKRGAPSKSVQTHMSYSGIVGNRITGGLSNEVVDEFQLAREVDVFGTSGFPKWLMGDKHPIYHLMQTEIIAEAAREKPFYQVELQGGPGRDALLGTEVPLRRDICLWNWNTLAAGGKGVLYWQYRPEPAGLESPGFGLTGLNGEYTERALAAGHCAKELSRECFDRAKRVLPVNGIYLSRTSEVLCFCDGRREALYAESVAGVYEAAYHSCIPIRFVHADYVDRLISEKLQVMYLPMALSLSAHEIEQLKMFVESGGTLVSDACPGLYDEGGRLEVSSHALQELFGLRYIETQCIPKNGTVRIFWTDSCQPFAGSLYRQVVEPEPEVQVLGVFEDGRPAVTERRIGKGKAVWMGSFIANQYHASYNEGSRAAITRWMVRSGFELLSGFACYTPDPAGQYRTVLRLLETEDSYILVGVNHMEREAKITVSFHSEQEEVGKGVDLVIPPSDGAFITWRKQKAAAEHKAGAVT